MKIVNAKKIMGAALAAFLVGSFVSCGQENAVNYGTENINKVTKITGVAEATEAGIDFTALGTGQTVKEVASGITFTTGTAAGQTNVYPFVTKDKVYTFKVIQNLGRPNELEKLSFKILATGGVGEVTMNKDAFAFEATGTKEEFKVTTKKVGDVDYVTYPVKAFSDNVDQATVTYGYARADIDENAGETETALTFNWNSKDKLFKSVLAKTPVLYDSKVGVTQPNSSDVTTNANNDVYWKLIGNDWYVRQTIKIAAKGQSNNTVFTISDKKTAVKAVGDKVVVYLSYMPAVGSNSSIFNSSRAKTVSGDDTRDVIDGKKYVTKGILNTKVVDRYTFTGFGDKIATYETSTTEYYAVNAVKVNYGDKVAEPAEKPTLTLTYYKDEVNPYTSRTVWGTTDVKKFTDTTPISYTLKNISSAVNGSTVTTRVTGAATKYDGKIYFTATRYLNYIDNNQTVNSYPETTN